MIGVHLIEIEVPFAFSIHLLNQLAVHSSKIEL